MKVSKKSINLLLFLLLFCNFVSAHPFYVSICQIDHNEETQALEVSVKIFADDLLLALKENGHTHLYLGEEKEHPDLDTIINTYLTKKLQIRIDNKTLNHRFVGREQEKDVVWIYLEMEQVDPFHSLEIECSMLTEVLPDQSNIVQVRKSDARKNLLLNKRKTKGTLHF